MIRNPSWNPLSDTTTIMVLAIVYVLAATCYHLGTILEPSARSASNVIFGRFVLSPGDLFKILKRRPCATASRGALALLGFFLEFYTRLRSSFRAHRNCVWRFKEADVRGANAGPNICEYIEFSGAGGRNLQTSSDPRPETSRQLRSSR